MIRNRKGAILGVFFGIILVLILTVVLFNNEGRSINRIRALQNIDDAVEISSTDLSIANGMLVMFNGMTETNETLTDDVFGVIAPESALKLRRTALMYQWVEEDENEEDEVDNYVYHKEWVDYLVNSDDFYYTVGHENPKSFNYKSNDFEVNNVTIGSYTLSYPFVYQLNNYIPYENIKTETQLDVNMSVINDMIYISKNGKINIDNPQIGDVKIQFTYVPSEITTVLGEKSSSDLLSFYTKNGDLAEVEYGKYTKESLKAIKLQQNKSQTWAIRIGCIIGLMIAIGLIFSPLTNLFGRIPILGNIINGGFALIGFALGTAWGVTVIAVGWLFYRPVIGVGLIALVVVWIVFLSKMKKDKQPAQNNIN